MLLMFDDKHKKHLAFLLDIDNAGENFWLNKYVVSFRDILSLA